MAVVFKGYTITRTPTGEEHDLYEQCKHVYESLPTPVFNKEGILIGKKVKQSGSQNTVSEVSRHPESKAPENNSQ